ncbi:hypothetical protein [Hymenobacter rubripertinctus]|uniref:hypothetical protein n=1 Tax=Hymenobacter rubripertinctus TaxID=2029981 RepID=UPI0036D2D5E9
MNDILLDENDDLLFENGDLVMGPSEEQEIGLILRTNQGDWRTSPLTGFGVDRRTRNEVNRVDFEGELASQLRLDGFEDAQVRLSEQGELSVNARRHA